MAGTINRKYLVGREAQFSLVIWGGILHQWNTYAFGWKSIRTATEDDKKRYRTVVDDIGGGGGLNAK